MVTKLKEVDAVIVGLGWTGGILAKELTEAGLKVVALERGAPRSTDKDYSLPNIRDELRYVVRHDLMQNTARDTITIRNNPGQEALPMRRLGSFLPGEVVGGSGVHWSGHTWRWTDMEFKIRSNYEERYGKKFIPEDMTIQDWGITYAELEPYYDKFEYVAAVAGKAGNIKGQIQPGGNPFEAPREREYALPPLTSILASEMFSEAARQERSRAVRPAGRSRGGGQPRLRLRPQSRSDRPHERQAECTDRGRNRRRRWQLPAFYGFHRLGSGCKSRHKSLARRSMAGAATDGS